MIYIGFSERSHKFLASVLCKQYKHCAPIIKKQNKYVLYQFTNTHKISFITLSKRDLNILEQYGWVFVKYNHKIDLYNAMHTKSFTCVQFTKKLCGIKDIRIQTPDSLLKHIK